MSTNILDDLEWRGLIAQSTDREALRRDLADGVLTLYAGFDPTGPSLHAGHLVPLLTLRRFQQAGARPIVLAGGGAGLVTGGRHVRLPAGTPLANLHLTVLDKMGIPAERLGNSTGEVAVLSDV